MAVTAHTVLSTFFLFGVAVHAKVPADFNEFVKVFERSYQQSSPEYQLRRQIYETNAAKAHAQNSNPQGLWTAGSNEFWDWSMPELSKLLGWSEGARPAQSFGGARVQPIRKVGFLQNTTQKALPLSKSWTGLQTTKKIWNQGACGSCWAVAAVTVLQAATEISGKMRTFSAQEFVDCVPNPKECGGQGGCKGATVELAFEWVMKHDASDASQVPYLGFDMPARVCPNTVLGSPAPGSPGTGGSAFGMVGWEMLPRNKYEPLMRALAENGPVALSVAASEWQMYESGIFDGCSRHAIVNHAVTGIGYGFDPAKGTKFWHIQNSWGGSWGEHGTIRILRRDDDDKRCGIDSKPEQGSACKGGPSQVTVCGMCGILYDSVTAHMKR